MVYLVVDADGNFREALARALRLEGHEVRTASTAHDALPQLALGGVECCVIDTAVESVDAVLSTARRAGVRTVVTGVHHSLTRRD